MDKGKTSSRGATGASESTRMSTDSMGTQPGRTAGEWAGDTTVGTAGASGSAAGMAGATGSTAGTAGATGSTAGRSGAGNGRESAGVVDQVKNRAAKELSSQKGKATGELDAVAQAVRDASSRLRQEDHETVAGYVEQAAGGLERLSQAIREKDLNELLHDAQRLARRQPAWFIGGSFALGLLAARFLKSSSSTDEDRWSYPEGSRGPWTDPDWQTGATDWRTGTASGSTAATSTPPSSRGDY